MKFVILLVLLMPVCGSAQSSLPFVTLAAGSKNQGNQAVTAWATDYGSYDVTFHQSTGIEVKMRNMSRAAAKMMFRVVFFAKLAGTNTKTIFSLAERTIELKTGEEISEVLPSPLLKRRDENYAAIGVRYQTGSKYEGWLVQVLSDDGKQLNRQLGSTSYLEDLAKTPDFVQLMDDYLKNAKTRK